MWWKQQTRNIDGYKIPYFCLFTPSLSWITIITCFLCFERIDGICSDWSNQTAFLCAFCCDYILPTLYCVGKYNQWPHPHPPASLSYCLSLFLLQGKLIDDYLLLQSVFANLLGLAFHRFIWPTPFSFSPSIHLSLWQPGSYQLPMCSDLWFNLVLFNKRIEQRKGLLTQLAMLTERAWQTDRLLMTIKRKGWMDSLLVWISLNEQK